MAPRGRTARATVCRRAASGALIGRAGIRATGDRQRQTRQDNCGQAQTDGCSHAQPPHVLPRSAEHTAAHFARTAGAYPVRGGTQWGIGCGAVKVAFDANGLATSRHEEGRWTIGAGRGPCKRKGERATDCASSDAPELARVEPIARIRSLQTPSSVGRSEATQWHRLHTHDAATNQRVRRPGDARTYNAMATKEGQR